MYSHYGVNPYNTKMKLKLILKLIIDAHKKELENKLWSQWLVNYSRMTHENFISFEEYKRKAFELKISNKVDVKKILENAEKIKNADLERRN